MKAEVFENQLYATGIAGQNELVQAVEQMSLGGLVSKMPRDYSGPERLELIAVEPTNTAQEAFKTMFYHRIQCVAVVQPTAQEPVEPSHFRSSKIEDVLEKKIGVFAEKRTVSWGLASAGAFQGFVDVLDLATHLAKGLEAEDAGDTTHAEVLATPVGSLVDASHKNKAHPLYEGQSLLAAMRLFARGIHRVPLFDLDKHIMGICSQTDAVDLLSGLLEKGVAVGMGSRSVSQYREAIGGVWGPNQVVWVSPDASMREALTTMASAGLTTIAIVADGRQEGVRTTGRLVGHLSAIQLEPMLIDPKRPLAYWLGKTVMECLNAFADRWIMPVCQLPDLTLAQACKLMKENRTHHIWIVEDFDENIPLGVVSMTDICRIVVDFRWPGWLL